MTLLYDQIAHSQYQQKHWQHQQQQKALSVARVSLLLFNHLYDESVVYTYFFLKNALIIDSFCELREQKRKSTDTHTHSHM